MIAPYRDHSPFCRWLPAVLVHGRQEQVLHLRDRLLLQYCGKCTTRVIKWDGHPRVQTGRCRDNCGANNRRWKRDGHDQGVVKCDRIDYGDFDDE